MPCIPFLSGPLCVPCAASTTTEYLLLKKHCQPNFIWTASVFGKIGFLRRATDDASYRRKAQIMLPFQKKTSRKEGYDYEIFTDSFDRWGDHRITFFLCHGSKGALGSRRTQVVEHGCGWKWRRSQLILCGQCLFRISGQPANQERLFLRTGRGTILSR